MSDYFRLLWHKVGTAAGCLLVVPFKVVLCGYASNAFLVRNSSCGETCTKDHDPFLQRGSRTGTAPGGRGVPPVIDPHPNFRATLTMNHNHN